MTKFQLKTYEDPDDTVDRAPSKELASKPELLRKLFEKTGYLPNTDLAQATRTEFTFPTSHKDIIYIRFRY